MARRVAVALVAFVLCSLPFAWFGAQMARHDVWQVTGPTMGTTYAVTVVSEWGRPWPEDIQPAVDAQLVDVNQWMSTYDPESELSQFNTSESTDWFEVSSETADVVAFALALAEDSGGAYDPTIGPVVNLWGFGPGKRRGRPPTDDEITAAKKRVGWQLVQARVDPPAIKKSQADVYLDLSSVAKGYGSDSVSNLLVEQGVADSMVEIGGEVRTRGTKPGGFPWVIGIAKLDAATGQGGPSVVELTDGALATSGDAYNFFEWEGARYSHTIDPQTGRPVTHRTASVSVRAADCMTADALATTLLVMGSDAGYDWAEERGVAALFIDRADDDAPGETTAFSEKATPAWSAATNGTYQP